MSVVEQIRTAFRSGNLVALIVGAMLGALVPITTFTTAHYVLDVPGSWATDASYDLLMQPATYIVAGGLLFSAYSVVGWTARAFNSTAKAIGFTVLIEGAMTFLDVPWLSWVCLAYLVGINAIVAGCSLAVDRLQARKPASKRRAKVARSDRATLLRKVG